MVGHARGVFRDILERPVGTGDERASESVQNNSWRGGG